MKSLEKSLWIAPLACVLLAAPAPSTLHAAPPEQVDWSDADRLAVDPEEGAAPCDWIAIDARRTDSALSFRILFAGPVDFERGAAYNIYLDTDRDPATGFKGSSSEFPLGADLLVQGASLFRYSGSGSDWSWTQFGSAEFTINDHELNLTLQTEKAGIKADAVDLFCLGDNEAEGVNGNTLDLLPDNAFTAGAKLTVRKK